MKPTRVTAGATSLSRSSHFPNIAYSKKVNPVTLPPGRTRLEMKPCPTGSVTSTKTIGIERIACTASERITLPFATMTSGASRASSATAPRMRPISPAVQRQSMRRFCPLGPTQRPQALLKGRRARLSFRIILRIVHQHADPPHAITLLGTRSKRPHSCRAAEQRDEFAAPS
jgi:hypothetical protein